MAAGAVAQIIELLGNPRGCPIRYTVADGVQIAKGTLLKITDPRTAAAQTGSADAFAGIAAAEKVASDGSTTLAVYTKGLFLIESGAAITAGERVYPATEANKVLKCDATAILKATVGTALETAAGDAEAIAIKIGGLGY